MNGKKKAFKNFDIHAHSMETVDILEHLDIHAYQTLRQTSYVHRPYYSKGDWHGPLN
jgi:hypothetical protein